MSEHSLAKLLGDLRVADDERLRLPRDGTAFELASQRVERLSRAVWAAATDDLIDGGDVPASPPARPSGDL
jgi:hypothetical protein